MSPNSMASIIESGWTMKNNTTEAQDKCINRLLLYHFCVNLPVIIASYPVFRFMGMRSSLPLPSCSDFHDYHHRLIYFKSGNYSSTFVYMDGLFGTDTGYRKLKAMKSEETSLAAKRIWIMDVFTTH
ncbi:hypothetical protein E3N88_22178 [Mikania micrantha]|uniref:Fatty acid hydroxylase domain-containing protein n=1 Tax=Mikania micrantha TaxID=192012 RepID=A0A5N6NBB7_9ASTR|nr:hypothetical protein E3N88_22178 [Mikania micrantha]